MSLLNVIQSRFALSQKGATDFCKGTLLTTLLDVALMLPAIYVFLFLDDYLRPLLLPDALPVHGVWWYVLLGVLFLGVMYIFAVWQYRSTYTSVYDESAVRRIGLAEKLRRLPLAFFGEKDLSDLTATMMDDCTDLEHTFSHSVPQLFASLLTIVLVAAGMFCYDWRMALALFWVVPVALGGVLLSKRLMHRGNEENYRLKRDVSEHIQEGLETMQEIKSYCLEAGYLAALQAKIGKYERRLTRNELLLGVLVNGSQAVLKLGLASVILVGALLLASGAIGLFVYLVFIVIGSRVYAPIEEVMNNLAALFYLDVRIDRMNEMEAQPVQTGTTDFRPVNYDIEFSHVAFSYEQGKTVLQDVSFVARQGEVTALVGSSGSGKSTVARLAARFWDIGSGRITLGGQDIVQVDPETLLKCFSIVFQDVVLFNTSVKDNIRIGRRNASDDEVLRVARLARCDEFVSRLPQGYDTVIGENGDTLSGGERQRISIARALLKDAPIVLLDEATASLDVENETLVQAGISELVRGNTLLIIAHRMRTIAQADKVVALSDGRVAEQGTPQELLARGGLFARMVERQRVPSGYPQG